MVEIGSSCTQKCTQLALAFDVTTRSSTRKHSIHLQGARKYDASDVISEEFAAEINHFKVTTRFMSKTKCMAWECVMRFHATLRRSQNYDGKIQRNDISIAIEIPLANTTAPRDRASNVVFDDRINPRIEFVRCTMCIVHVHHRIWVEYTICNRIPFSFRAFCVLVRWLGLLLTWCPQFLVRKYIFSSRLFCWRTAFQVLRKACNEISDQIVYRKMYLYATVPRTLAPAPHSPMADAEIQDTMCIFPEIESIYYIPFP